LPEQGSNSQSVFNKYGYVEFGNQEPDDEAMREMKKIEQINIKALYMRLVLWQNHENILNFFNQVGLS
jgi:hypothetical protein